MPHLPVSSRVATFAVPIFIIARRARWSLAGKDFLLEQDANLGAAPAAEGARRNRVVPARWSSGGTQGPRRRITRLALAVEAFLHVDDDSTAEQIGAPKIPETEPTNFRKQAWAESPAAAGGGAEPGGGSRAAGAGGADEVTPHHGAPPPPPRSAAAWSAVHDNAAAAHQPSGVYESGAK